MIKQVLTPNGWKGEQWMVFNLRGYPYGRTFQSEFEAEYWLKILNEKPTPVHYQRGEVK